MECTSRRIEPERSCSQPAHLRDVTIGSFPPAIGVQNGRSQAAPRDQQWPNHVKAGLTRSPWPTWCCPTPVDERPGQRDSGPSLSKLPPVSVRDLVRQLELLFPTMGNERWAQVLGRAGLVLGATTIRRMVREDVGSPEPDTYATKRAGRNWNRVRLLALKPPGWRPGDHADAVKDCLHGFRRVDRCQAPQRGSAAGAAQGVHGKHTG